jgi:large subunit ribosomal protein L19
MDDQPQNALHHQSLITLITHTDHFTPNTMNQQQTIENIVAKQLKPAGEIPDMTIGDTINVHVRIVEGDKERVQVYQGVLIGQKGRGVNTTITVRRIVANEGVERVFPLHSPRIAQLEVVRRGDARRAKLYYLRDRVGKSQRLRDQRRGLKHVSGDATGVETPSTATTASE